MVLLCLFVCFSSLQHASHLLLTVRKKSLSAAQTDARSPRQDGAWLRVNSNPPEVHKTISPLQSALRDEWQQESLLFPRMGLNHLWMPRIALFHAKTDCFQVDLQVEATWRRVLPSLESFCNISERMEEERQIRPLRIPDDSHICKLMQIVVNLGAASVGKVSLKTRQNVASFSRLCVDEASPKRDAAAPFLKTFWNLCFCFCKFVFTWRPKHERLLHLLGFCRKFASLSIHVNAMEKGFVLRCHSKKISASSAKHRSGLLFQMFFLSGLLLSLPPAAPLLSLTAASALRPEWGEKRGGFAAPLCADDRVGGAAVIPPTQWGMATHLAYAN